MLARYLLSMASLCLVDLSLSGVYVAISGRIDVLPEALALNLLMLGALNAAVASRIYRPIAAGAAPGAGEAARAAAARRLETLPWCSAAWAAGLSVVYTTAVFASGVFTPDEALIDDVPLATRLLALVWFVFVYAVYYGFYVYFLIGDFSDSLRARMFFEHGLAIEPRRGGFRRKLSLALLVIALVPNAHLILDLTAFRAVRLAQGLGVLETVLLDLFATLVVLCLALVFITRTLTRPVNALVAAVERTAAGDLDARVPVGSDDELGVLSAQFNRMLEGLRERAFIRETFGRYVPESVVAAVIEGRGTVQPTLARATILFADIADFTATCESMPPRDVVDMLNEYYSAVIEPIDRHGGVVNQFQGDAMLVTFNVPVADPEHADNAVDAALGMRAAIAGKRFGGVELHARIGINTGDVVAGNVGSPGRYNYTVHGDAVNVASRLEQMNKTLGTDLLVSESTVELLGREHGLQPIGELAMRGKSRAVRVFGLARAGEAPPGVEDDAAAARGPAR